MFITERYGSLDFSALNSGALEALGKGALVTVTISSVSILLGLVVGLPLAFTLLAPNAIIASFANLYRSFWRGTPLLVQLFIVFYLPPKVGIDVPPFIAAVIALTMNTAAFQAEIYRAGLQAIPPVKWRPRKCWVSGSGAFAANTHSSDVSPCASSAH